MAGSAGAAFGGDGTLYVCDYQRRPVSLEPKTLKVKDVYRAGQEFTSSPVVFQYNEKTMIAATTKDGRIHLVDAAAMCGRALRARHTPRRAISFPVRLPPGMMRPARAGSRRRPAGQCRPTPFSGIKRGGDQRRSGGVERLVGAEWRAALERAGRRAIWFLPLPRW